MKIFAVFCLWFAAALCAPSEERPSRALPALENVYEVDEKGQYTLKYVTAEGTVVAEEGRLVATPDGGQVLVHDGHFTFLGDDGKTYLTKYKTSILGAYEVEGDHLPKPVELEVLPEVLEMPKIEEPVILIV